MSTLTLKCTSVSLAPVLVPNDWTAEPNVRSAASNPAAACSPGTPQKVIPVGSPALQYGGCRFVKSDPFATTSPSASSWKYASPFDVLAAGTSGGGATG